MIKSKIKSICLSSFFLFLLTIGSYPFNLTATLERNYVVNGSSNLEIDIVIEEKEVSLDINYSCDNCVIDFLFLDYDNYIKYSNNQSYDERLIVRNRESYTIRIFISTNGTWWVVFENKDSIYKTVDFTYEEVDPPIKEDWIFWVMLTPWLIGFFSITGYWFYRKRSKPQNQERKN